MCVPPDVLSKFLISKRFFWTQTCACAKFVTTQRGAGYSGTCAEFLKL